MPGMRERLAHAWNAFNARDPTSYTYSINASSSRPDRVRLSGGNERSIITAVYNRMALDCANIQLKHIKRDDQGRFKTVIESGLNNALTLDANRDQTGRALMQDAVLTMFDEGVVCVVPTHTTISPVNSNAYDVLELRVARILEWRPNHVRVKVYNEDKGEYEELLLPKNTVAIVQNPFYTVMNERNSILQRLIRKMNLLDVIDEQSGSGKLDLIIQLPYAIKTEARMKQAESRRAALEEQLAGSKYGIAYTDSTEKVTQLNRSLENNLLKQIEYLTEMLYSQLGITVEVMNGTAEDTVMLNYNSRTIEPIVSAFADEFTRKFLSKTARTQGQDIMYFSDPFKLVPVTQIADIADKFTRNEILSSNELRGIVGFKPVDDEKADELRNKNLNVGAGQEFTTTEGNRVLEQSQAAKMAGEQPAEEAPKVNAIADKESAANAYTEFKMKALVDNMLDKLD